MEDRRERGFGVGSKWRAGEKERNRVRIWGDELEQRKVRNLGKAKKGEL